MKVDLVVAATRRLVTPLFLAELLLLGSTPAGALVPVSPGGMPAEWSAPAESLVQPAHCRPFWHTHRRCVSWSRGGVCRSSRTWRHRC